MARSASDYQVIAGDMLTSFSGTAMEWPVELDIRAAGDGPEQAHLVCTQCRQSVLPLSLDVATRAYVHTPLRLAAGVLRHVREVHCDGGGNLA